MKKPLVFIIILSVTVFSCENTTKKNELENPLLSNFNTPFNLPPFEKIKPKHFVPAFEEGMKQHNEAVEKIINNTEAPTFTNTIEAYWNSSKLLNEVNHIFNSTIGANTNPELEKIASDISPKLASHRDELLMNAKLFKRIKTVFDKYEDLQITAEQRYLLENLYKSFVQNGALLAADKQTELKKVNQELSSLEVKYEQNVLAETNDYKLIIENKDDLKGLPESVIAASSEEATKAKLNGKWLFTTQKPSIIPFLQYAENRALREKLYKAYITRGNNNNKFDNKKTLARIVSLRFQKANLLGYKNYAAYKLENRMAKTPEKAMELLNKLWDKAIKVAKNDAKELQKIIDKEGGKFKLAAWDWSYYSEKLRKQKYDLDENELRPYFKLENVREGIFTVGNKLYGYTFTAMKDLPIPHPDAEAYDVKNSNGIHLGIFYFDFFPRKSKNGGAWCNEYRTHHIENGKEITPVVTVVCNFTKPTKDLPSLLSMDEVTTLFHECGHAFESLSSKTSYTESYSAQDFVELPSQLMEHWAFHKDVIRLWAKHFKTGAVIPDALVDKIHNSSLFNQGFASTEYIAASMLDMALHMVTDTKEIDVEKFENNFFTKEGLIPEIDSRYKSTYFTHIMGGYDAGYYGYIWSTVLDNDAFEAFQEKGVFDKATANAFLINILEKDGVADPQQMYFNFRGREAKIEPLLKNRGLL